MRKTPHMSFITKKDNVIVQGITGNAGSFHTEQMIAYGTPVVGGVTPGKGGQKVCGVPVYNTVKEAVKKHKASWSCLFVPARFVKQAALEALSANLNLVIISEEVPVHDALAIHYEAKKRKKIVLGPNCPGLCEVGVSKIGIMPNQLFSKGHVGIVSRSGTLTYEIIAHLTKNKLGQSTILGTGGDSVVGTNFLDALKYFEKDQNTHQIVLIGEIGGSLEEEAARYIHKYISKPVVAYVAGRTAPPGKHMGHAGAIVSGNTGTVKSKVAAFKKAGVPVATLPSQIPLLVKRLR